MAPTLKSWPKNVACNTQTAAGICCVTSNSLSVDGFEASGKAKCALVTSQGEPSVAGLVKHYGRQILMMIIIIANSCCLPLNIDSPVRSAFQKGVPSSFIFLFVDYYFLRKAAGWTVVLVSYDICINMKYTHGS